MKKMKLYKITLSIVLLSVGINAAAQSNVGMGTITPVTTLDVRGTDSTAAITVGTQSSSYGALFLGNNAHGLRRSFPSNVANNNNIGLYTTSGSVYLSSNGATDFSKFVLTNAGDVGIGTGTPLVKLDVVGSIAATGNLTLGSIATGSGTDQVLTVTAGGVVNKRTVAAIAPATDFYTTDGTLTGARTVSQGSNNLTFSGTGNVLLTSGSVGVGGAISATAKLNVTGNAATTGTLTVGTLASGTATDSVLTVTAAGLVHKRAASAVAPEKNIYTTDDTLTGLRTVYLNGNRLDFKGTNGSYSFRTGGNNFNTDADELVVSQSGDVLGSTLLRLRNRTGENGLKISTNVGVSAPDVADLVLENFTGSRYVRAESRAAKKFGTDGVEMQLGVESDPGLVVGSSFVTVRADKLNVGTSSTVNSTPTEIIMDNSMSITAGANPKLLLAGGGVGYGLGVSSNQLNYMIPAGAKHSFYTGGALKLSINSDNTITTASGASLTGGSWTNASDLRLKKDIAGIGYGLKEVMKLRPVFYHMKANNEAQIGFIAQELRKVIPEVVVGKEGDLSKGEILSVSYGNLAAVLTKAIQEQQAQITQQATSLEAQAATIAALQQENKALKAQAAQVASLAAEMADLRSDISRLVLNKMAKGKTAGR